MRLYGMHIACIAYEIKIYLLCSAYSPPLPSSSRHLFLPVISRVLIHRMEILIGLEISQCDLNNVYASNNVEVVRHRNYSK